MSNVREYLPEAIQAMKHVNGLRDMLTAINYCIIFAASWCQNNKIPQRQKRRNVTFH